MLLEIAANYEKLASNLRTDLVTDCPICHRPMLEADTCAVSHVTFSDDAKAERRRYAGETRCHDCGVAQAGFITHIAKSRSALDVALSWFVARAKRNTSC